ncbi:MbtH family protein [Streptomyces sp. rh34]|uniref:MbtH family protein n=1 Tax=Streptomyces sp. rh34 TaxID=2034272 RepID=UPI000BEF6332|nr:MbtH family NRPS accessory protein [Streptomyces sp. rh34]
MSSPFEDNDGEYIILVNGENQHSLWPSALDVPAGWRVAHGPDSRQGCLDFVEVHWTDLRPASQVAESGGR